ncbi:MAG: hypothetical protein LBM38_04675 [Clostridiales bacterium]|jgi:hypothetical protein|nr:hypothetical protein [Clostridiales bacterium]
MDIEKKKMILHQLLKLKKTIYGTPKQRVGRMLGRAFHAGLYGCMLWLIYNPFVGIASFAALYTPFEVLAQQKKSRVLKTIDNLHDLINTDDDSKLILGEKDYNRLNDYIKKHEYAILHQFITSYINVINQDEYDELLEANAKTNEGKEPNTKAYRLGKAISKTKKSVIKKLKSAVMSAIMEKSDEIKSGKIGMRNTDFSKYFKR